MHQRDAGLVPVQLEGGNGGRVLGADDDHVLVVVRVRLLVIVQDLILIFAGDAEEIGDVVVSGGEDDLLRPVDVVASAAIGCGDFEGAVGTGDVVDALILVDVELIVVGDAAVVFQGFGTAGLFGQAGHGDVADLEQLRGGEEDQIDRIVVDGVYYAALLDQDGLQAAALQLDAAGEAGGTGAHYERVEGSGHSMFSTDL